MPLRESDVADFESALTRRQGKGLNPVRACIRAARTGKRNQLLC